MTDTGRPSGGGYVSSDRDEMQLLLQSCGHWMLLCAAGVTPDPGRARPVVDVQPGGGAPAMAMFAAIAELLVAGETVLVACKAAPRLEKVATVARRMGWQVLPMAGRGPAPVAAQESADGPQRKPPA